MCMPWYTVTSLHVLYMYILRSVAKFIVLTGVYSWLRHRCVVPAHQPGLILPTWLSVRSKVTIATKCTLWYKPNERISVCITKVCTLYIYMFLWSIWCLINWYPHTHAVLIYFCVSAPPQYIFRGFPHTFFSSFGSNIKTLIARVQIQRSAVFSQRKIVAKTLKEKIC